MRIGLVSDIHGNLAALDAVLADAAGRRVDRWIDLGDLLYGPLDPLGTYERLRALDADHLCGNQDRDLFDADAAAFARNPTLRFDCETLGHPRLEWLRSLPTTLSFGEVFACHGTPTNDLVYLLEDVESGDSRVRDEAEIHRLLDGIGAPLVLCGHTHIPRAVRLSNGQLIVNPGSVGVPAYDDDLPFPHRMQNHSPDASYAIVERGPRGWKVEHMRVPYDFDAAARMAESRGRSDWAGWLRTGRADLPAPSPR
jgi:diadenosine tetraphosphatase ApaH/serine/threonine PP2A family protein phosphatase